MVRFEIEKNYEAMSERAAQEILDAILKNPEAAIVLATGHSPLYAYRELVRKIREQKADVSRVTFVKLDEWAGLSPEDGATCEAFLQKEIIGPLGIREENYIHFQADCQDATAECARIDALYRALPQVDLVILGIGMNGHLGLNEPADCLYASAHVTELNEKTKTHEMLTHTERPVTQGVTLGMENLFSGKKILLLADGREKEAGLKGLLEDGISTRVPVSFLKLHPNCLCLINKESFPGLETDGNGAKWGTAV
ncbi:MAG TPA: 6-phosphogluconolactonase [Candidatus Eisenbergiella merdigallinarum]|uniref:6-phosphogluconolactonase n=1 Tax=Candidatus Eisenbergiella merdigallinarum TaxID=2838552 RepID=A0A9D2MUN4_9FIRM|nr:6-phosphogluconolactonase [Candidatus Eisenbergiella merdigallinarum]